MLVLLCQGAETKKITAASFFNFRKGKVAEDATRSLKSPDVILSADSKGDFPLVFFGPRSKKLDIVMAHYDPDRTADALDFWLKFLKTKKMAEMKPFVWLYCQNDRVNLTGLTPLVRGGGEMVHLDNIGREGHAYLQHITRRYDDLAEFTLFTQDIPDGKMPVRFEKQFQSNTGYLPLSFTGKVDCFQDTSTRMIAQLHGIFTRSLCPIHGFYGGFEGQHVVSRRRILGQDLGIYKHLLELLAAPEEHWLHEYHDANEFKKPDNPLFGHALERAWTLVFNCYEVWRIGNCLRCDNDGFEGCTKDDCQCYDLPLH